MSTSGMPLLCRSALRQCAAIVLRSWAVFGVRSIVVAMLALATSTRAVADPEPDKPWAVGVSDDQQKQALALYKEGNAFFGQNDYKDAVAKYDQALAIWDHPAIRYNRGVCLINLDRPVEAYEDLQAALRYGDKPLDPATYQQGISFQKLLAARVAEVDVSATSAGAKVTLDGQPLEVGAGVAKKHVVSGDHQIVAEQPGYQTETRPVHVNGGDTVTVVIELHPLAARRELRRRFARWIPWTVMGTGGAIALAGIPLYLASRSSWNTYDARVNAECTMGCVTLPADVASARSTARLENGLEIGAFALGGALVATGVALVVLDQPRLVAPIVERDRVGLVVSGRW